MFKRIPRYSVVGLICAGIYNVTMIVGDRARLHYALSTLIAFVLVVGVGYVLHCTFTFSERLTVRGLARYTGAMALSLPLSVGGMYLLRDVFHLPMIIASPTLTISLFLWNYVATHWAVVSGKVLRKKSHADEVAP